jgi:hypothetical protein
LVIERSSSGALPSAPELPALRRASSSGIPREVDRLERRAFHFWIAFDHSLQLASIIDEEVGSHLERQSAVQPVFNGAGEMTEMTGLASDKFDKIEIARERFL